MVEKETPNKPRIWVFDLDGVLIDSTIRAKKHMDVSLKAAGRHEEWERCVWAFTTGDHGDDVIIRPGVALCNALVAYDRPDHVFIVTSRHTSEHAASVDTLEKGGVFDEWAPSGYFMRHDKRVCPVSNDVLVTPEEEFDHVTHKGNILVGLQQQYEVLGVVDDHGGIVKRAQELGIHAIQPFFASIQCLQLFGDHISLGEPSVSGSKS